jgi:lambda repressor-like predicted transcriptional regulator
MTTPDTESDNASRQRAQFEDAYLSLRTLSSYSGLSIRTLRSYLNHMTHSPPCYRIGGKVLVRRSEYDFWASRFRARVAPAVDRVVDVLMRGLV